MPCATRIRCGLGAGQHTQNIIMHARVVIIMLLNPTFPSEVLASKRMLFPPEANTAVVTLDHSYFEDQTEIPMDRI